MTLEKTFVILTLLSSIMTGFFIIVSMSINTKKPVAAMIAAACVLTVIVYLFNNRNFITQCSTVVEQIKTPNVQTPMRACSAAYMSDDVEQLQTPMRACSAVYIPEFQDAGSTDNVIQPPLRANMRNKGRHNVVGDVNCNKMKRFTVADKGIPQPLAARTQWLQYVAAEQLHASDPYLTRTPLQIKK